MTSHQRFAEPNIASTCHGMFAVTIVSVGQIVRFSGIQFGKSERSKPCPAVALVNFQCVAYRACATVL